MKYIYQRIRISKSGILDLPRDGCIIVDKPELKLYSKTDYEQFIWMPITEEEEKLLNDNYDKEDKRRNNS